MSSNVSFMRLLNGDDIIAEVVERKKATMIFRNPMVVLNNVELEEGRQTLILYPWIPQGIALANTVELHIKDILLVNEIEPEIKDYYDGIIQSFSQKPKVVSSTTPKASNSGKNVISFNRPKNLKDS
jgi:hypothetical protein